MTGFLRLGVTMGQGSKRIRRKNCTGKGNIRSDTNRIYRK